VKTPPQKKQKTSTTNQNRALSIMGGTRTCTWFLVPWHMLSVFAKLHAATPSKHNPRQTPSTTSAKSQQLPPHRLGKKTPLRCGPPLPTLVPPIPHQSRTNSETSDAKTENMCQTILARTCFEKPNFCWSSAPVNICSPNDHFGSFSCPNQKNQNFYTKTNVFQKKIEFSEIISELTP
jgi:hypothetical protein